MSTGPEPAFTMPCWNCPEPIMQDALGWRHVNPDNTGCLVPGPDEHEADRTTANVTRAAGEVAQ